MSAWLVGAAAALCLALGVGAGRFVHERPQPVLLVGSGTVYEWLVSTGFISLQQETEPPKTYRFTDSSIGAPIEFLVCETGSRLGLEFLVTANANAQPQNHPPRILAMVADQKCEETIKKEDRSKYFRVRLGQARLLVVCSGLSADGGWSEPVELATVRRVIDDPAATTQLVLPSSNSGTLMKFETLLDRKFQPPKDSKGGSTERDSMIRHHDLREGLPSLEGKPWVALGNDVLFKRRLSSGLPSPISKLHLKTGEDIENLYLYGRLAAQNVPKVGEPECTALRAIGTKLGWNSEAGHPDDLLRAPVNPATDS